MRATAALELKGISCRQSYATCAGMVGVATAGETLLKEATRPDILAQAPVPEGTEPVAVGVVPVTGAVMVLLPVPVG